jgi:predicted aconitase with swiveling domain
MELSARCIWPGSGRGEILFTRQPISFWGCVDPATGLVSDKRHELFQRSISGRVLVFPFGKGSSTGSLMILELLRVALAPSAIINMRTEPLLATGPVVGKHFYGKSFPIVNLDAGAFGLLESGLIAEVEARPERAIVRIRPNSESQL